jgi:hypothetical protein
MLQHRTRQEMHRKVRTTLTSVNGLSLKASRGKNWGENKNKTTMGIRPSNSLKKINSGSMMLSSPGFKHWNVSSKDTVPTVWWSNIHHCAVATAWLDPPILSYSVREGKRKHRKLSKTGETLQWSNLHHPTTSQPLTRSSNYECLNTEFTKRWKEVEFH